MRCFRLIELCSNDVYNVNINLVTQKKSINRYTHKLFAYGESNYNREFQKIYHEELKRKFLISEKLLAWLLMSSFRHRCYIQHINNCMKSKNPFFRFLSLTQINKFLFSAFSIISNLWIFSRLVKQFSIVLKLTYYVQI